MAKITYSSLKLKIKDEVKTIDYNGNQIEIKQYLPIEDKIDLIDIVLQKSKEDNIYNPMKMDMYFHLYLIYLYTNITFTEKQKEDEGKLYDILNSNGLIDLIIENLSENEYDYLLDLLSEKENILLSYNTTAAAIVANIINDLPKNAQIMADIMQNFNPEQYQNVINFAKAANGGRDIN